MSQRRRWEQGQEVPGGGTARESAGGETGKCKRLRAPMEAQGRAPGVAGRGRGKSEPRRRLWGLAGLQAGATGSFTKGVATGRSAVKRSRGGKA